MWPEESRYERGLAKTREMFGPGIDSALKSLAATSPDLQRYLVEFPLRRHLPPPRPGLEDEGNANGHGPHRPRLSAGRVVGSHSGR